MRSVCNSWSGITACLQNLEQTAHNLANLNTTAYKRAEMAFGDMLYHELHRCRFPVFSEQDLPVGQGTQVLAKAPFIEQGALIHGGRPLDLAIEGEGYFRLLGAAGEELYSRNGSFQLNEEGKLVSTSGDYLDVSFTLGEGVEKLIITPEGVLSITNALGENVELGLLRLYRFPNPSGLREVGAGRYQPGEHSGESMEGLPGDMGFGCIRQYYLELSNADLGKEIIGLITAQRALQANIRGLLTADELQAITLQIRI